MRAFQPSAGFVAFFNQVIAAAEAPVTAGSYAPEIPTFTNPQETSFVEVHLVPLINQVNAMRQSLTPAAAPPAPAPMWDPNMSTP